MVYALRDRLTKTIEFGKTVGRVQMTPHAREIWKAVYSPLTADQPGLLGAVVARGEAQVVRLALLYALPDQRM